MDTWGKKKKFNAAASKTAFKTGLPYYAEYADGSAVSGLVYTDKGLPSPRPSCILLRIPL